MRTIGKGTLVGLLAAGSALALMAPGCTDVVDSSQVESTPSEESVGRSAAALSFTNDFFDDFNLGYLDGNNWLAQAVWVNREAQCYDNTANVNGVPTVEVSGGSLKVRVLDRGYWATCNTKDKNNTQFYWNDDTTNHTTPYVAGRIATKSKKEFMGGRWKANLKLTTKKADGSAGQGSGIPGQFPAWWILGARNNENPITNAGYQNVCWPKRGSGEIDIMEHYGANGQDRFTARGIKLVSPFGCDNGNWSLYQTEMYPDLDGFHTYEAEFLTSGNIIYRIDGAWAGQSTGIGFDNPEPMFGILNYALTKGSYMNAGGINYKEYTMEVAWVAHDSVGSPCGIGNNVAVNAYNGYNYASAQAGDVLTATASTIGGWEQYDIVDAGGGWVALRSHKNNNYVKANMNDAGKRLEATSTAIGNWEKFQFVSQGGGYYGIKSYCLSTTNCAGNGYYVSTDSNAGSTLKASWATGVGDWEKFSCVRY